MAMALTELFYGGSDPAYFSYCGRHGLTSFPSYSQAQEFDLVVPMRCTNCEGQMRSALLAVGGATGAIVDRSQRLTVAGYNTDPYALRQREAKGATSWNTSGPSGSGSRQSHRVSTSSHQKPRQILHRSDRSGRGPYSEGGGSGAQQSDHRSYARTFCPSYQEGAVTHYMSVNPTIATRVEVGR